VEQTLSKVETASISLAVVVGARIKQSFKKFKLQARFRAQNSAVSNAVMRIRANEIRAHGNYGTSAATLEAVGRRQYVNNQSQTIINPPFTSFTPEK